MFYEKLKKTQKNKLKTQLGALRLISTTDFGCSPLGLRRPLGPLVRVLPDFFHHRLRLLATWPGVLPKAPPTPSPSHRRRLRTLGPLGWRLSTLRGTVAAFDWSPTFGLQCFQLARNLGVGKTTLAINHSKMELFCDSATGSQTPIQPRTIGQRTRRGCFRVFRRWALAQVPMGHSGTGFLVRQSQERSQSRRCCRARSDETISVKILTKNSFKTRDIGYALLVNACVSSRIPCGTSLPPNVSTASVRVPSWCTCQRDSS